MTAQYALKWTLILLITAGWTATSGSPLHAQAQDAPREEGERSFDASITVPELFEKARDAFGLNRIELAEEFYQEILIRERSNLQAMLELSNVYERSGKLEYARGLLLRSEKLAPDDRAIAARLASVEHMLTIVLAAEVDSLLAKKQYELAIPKLSVHLSIEPNNSELFYKRALCYANLGPPDAALSSIDKALKIDPQDKYYKLRSSILADLEASETKEMVAEAKELLQSDDPEDQQRALDILGMILAIDPEHEWARTEFVRLTGEDEEKAGEAGEANGEGRSIVETVSQYAAKAGRTAANLVQRHLSALILLVVAILVFRSPFTRLITKWFAAKPFLAGRFPKFSLTEILLMLNAESHTGVLHVKGESCRGKVYFENGEPCHCVVGRLVGVSALHHLLSHARSGHFEFVDGSIPLNRTVETPLSIVLVDQSSGGPGGAARRRASSKPKKSKSRMKELLESQSDK